MKKNSRMFPSLCPFFLMLFKPDRQNLVIADSAFPPYLSVKKGFESLQADDPKSNTIS